MIDSLNQLISRLKTAKRVTCLTGAGISAPSGVPTFRGAQGLWKNYRPEELATPEAFARDPLMVWQWYNWRRKLIAQCQPNRGHEVLAHWQHRFSEFTLITQNVDGLHERAGSLDVIRFHGSIWLLSCANKCTESPSQWWDMTPSFATLPPLCPYCEGLARPDVVWFGEAIDPAVLERSYSAARCDVFFSIGTSSVVHPAADLIAQAKTQGAFTVEINLEQSARKGVVDLFLEGSAEQVLEELRLTRSLSCKAF